MEPENNTQEGLKGFKDLLRELIVPKIEMIAIIILIIGLILKHLEIGKPASMLGISLTTLAVVFYLKAFLFPAKGLLENIAIKAGFIACSVALVGIMFDTLALPGAESMLNIGAMALGAGLIVVIYQLLNHPAELWKHIVIRYVAVLAATLMTIFF